MRLSKPQIVWLVILGLIACGGSFGAYWFLEGPGKTGKHTTSSSGTSSESESETQYIFHFQPNSGGKAFQVLAIKENTVSVFVLASQQGTVKALAPTDTNARAAMQAGVSTYSDTSGNVFQFVQFQLSTVGNIQVTLAGSASAEVASNIAFSICEMDAKDTAIPGSQVFDAVLLKTLPQTVVSAKNLKANVNYALVYSNVVSATMAIEKFTLAVGIENKE
jgi:hypothetical protein